MPPELVHLVGISKSLVAALSVAALSYFHGFQCNLWAALWSACVHTGSLKQSQLLQFEDNSWLSTQLLTSRCQKGSPRSVGLMISTTCHEASWYCETASAQCFHLHPWTARSSFQLPSQHIPGIAESPKKGLNCPLPLSCLPISEKANAKLALVCIVCSFLSNIWIFVHHHTHDGVRIVLFQEVTIILQ